MRKRRGYSPPWECGTFEKHRRVTRRNVIAGLLPPTAAVGIKSTAYNRNDVISEFLAYLKRNSAVGPVPPTVGSAPILDWNPAAGVTLSGGNVLAVADQSGHGNSGAPNVNQIVPLGPTLTAHDAAFQNKPSFAFTISETLACNSFSGIDPGGYTIFFRWIDTATGGSDPGGDLFAAKGLITGHVTKQIFEEVSTSSSAGNADGSIQDANGTSSFNIATDWALTGAAATYVHQCAGTNATHIIRKNGVTQVRGSTLSATDPGSGAPAGQTFSVSGDPNAGSKRTGRMARVLVYPTALSLADIQTIEAFLSANY